jgi:outer membrane protein OmpA-like peptidoglycan-associated protein
VEASQESQFELHGISSFSVQSFSVDNSQVAVKSGAFAYLAYDSPLLLENNSSLVFETLVHSIVWMPGVDNIDIRDSSEAIFENDFALRIAALRTISQDGGGKIIKRGKGELIFENAAYLMSPFLIESGTASFSPSASTVAAINILNGAALSLTLNSQMNSFFVLGDMSISGGGIFLDFNFMSKRSDFIRVFQTIDLSGGESHIYAELLEGGAFVIGTSIAFMSAQGVVSPDNLKLGGGISYDYELIYDDAKKTFYMRVPYPWDVFQKYWKAAEDGAILTLPDPKRSSVFAYAGALPLGEASVEAESLIIEGGGNTIDSRNFEDLGFKIIGKNVEFRDISFVNFKNVSGGGGALYVEAASVLIENAKFHANRADGKPNDIHMAGAAEIGFEASAGKKVELYGGITSEGSDNVIRKTGAGSLVFGNQSNGGAAMVDSEASSPFSAVNPQSETTLNFNGSLFIEAGGVKFDLPQSTIGAMTISDNALIEINIDLVGNGTSRIWIMEDINISPLSILSVSMLNGELSFGSSRTVISANNQSAPDDFNIVSGGRYAYKFKWSQNEADNSYAWRGDLTYRGVKISSDTIGDDSFNGDGSIFANLRMMGVKTSFNFDAARMRTARLGDAPIWLMLHNDGGYISQASGRFNQSATGFIVGGEWAYQSGAFASVKKVDASQDGDSATGSDIELGFYRGWSNDKVRLNGSLSFGFQSFSVNNGAAYINSKSARFSVEGELIDPIKSRAVVKGKSYGAGPFIGAQAGYIMMDKIKTKIQTWNYIDEGASSALEHKTDGEAIIPAASLMRLEILGGMKGWYKIKDFVFYGRIFGDAVLIGNEAKIQYASGEVYGADESFLLGLGLGIEYESDADTAVFIDSCFEVSENSFQYGVNIGLKFKAVKSKQPSPRTPKRAAKKPKPKPKPKPAPPPPPPPPPKPAPQPQPPAAPKEATKIQASETRKNAVQSFKVAAASFQSGRSDLSYEGKVNIRLLAEQIRKIGYKNILVEGHTDSSGSEALNMNLSRQRATMVLLELAQYGMEVQKMSYIGYASQNPIASNATPEGRAKNRRVEIVIE